MPQHGDCTDANDACCPGLQCYRNWAGSWWSPYDFTCENENSDEEDAAEVEAEEDAAEVTEETTEDEDSDEDDDETDFDKEDEDSNTQNSNNSDPKGMSDA